LEEKILEYNALENDDIVIDTTTPNSNLMFAVLMPVHNEESSITHVIEEIYHEFSKDENIAFEIILSEDGSKDNTKQVISSLSKKLPIKAILSHNKKGYLGGIKEGLKLVTAPFVLITDSDGQHDPKDFWKLKKILEEKEFSKDYIISGVRTTRSDDLHRRIISKTFQKLNKVIFDLPPLIDITSPFKLMSSELAKKIADECIYMKESFWTEYTIRALHNNVKLVEVPVSHRRRYEGETVVYKKSKIPKIVINQLLSVVDLKKDLTNKNNIITALHQTKSIRRVISFALVGVSGALIILFMSWLGVNLFHLHYIISTFIGIELSIVWAFFLNDKFTFSDRKNGKRFTKPIRFLKYHLTAFNGEAVNLLILFILTSAGMFYLFSECIAILAAFGINFFISNKWVWKNKSISSK
jgi:dolichol-phosphate mannosyltransferase